MQHSRSELRSLITRAINDTTLLIPRSEKSGPALHFQQFCAIASELRSHSPEAVRQFAQRYTPVESIGRDELSHYLRSLSSLDKYFDATREYVTCVGSPSTSVSVARPLSAVSSKIIMSAIVNSIDVATDALHDFLMADSFPIRLVYLLIGTKISKEIILDAHSKLIPADDAISLVGLSSDPPPGLAPLDKNLLGCALIVETNVQPGTWDSDRNIAPRVHIQGLAEENIGLLCGVLTLISQRQFYPFAQTHIIEQEIVDTLPIVEHSSIGGWTVLNHLVPVFPSDSVLPYLDTRKLRSIIGAYIEAGAEFKRRLRIPIARFQATAARMTKEDRYIDLAIAFEAMLITGNEEGITSRLAERAAWLYAETENEKSWARRKVRAFYGRRSAIVHGKEVSNEGTELYSNAQSIFIVCLKNIIQRQAFPDWDSIDVSGTIGSPVADAPSTILSAKHDATSWTIGELKRIDEALSNHWETTLQGVLPSGSGNGAMMHTGDVRATIAEFEDRNEAYVHVDPYQLRDAHPLWREASGNGDEARIWHCGDDIRRHIRLWIEAALERRLTVIIDDTSAFFKDHPI